MAEKYIIKRANGIEVGLEENVNGKLDVQQADGTDLELILTEE